MRLLVVLASFAAVIGLAASAQAEPSSNESGLDSSFLAELDNAGITYHSKAEAIAVGRQACALMDQGASESDVVNNVAQQNPGFTVDSAAQFTAIALSAYCPQHIQQPAPPTDNVPPPQAWFPGLPPLPAAL